MRRTALLKQISKTAKAAGVEWTFVREGANHELWRFRDLLVPIPRHREINEMTAKGILGDVEEEANR